MIHLALPETLAKRLLAEWPLLLVFGCVIFMLYPVLDAEFGLIDDHEIVDMLGRSAQLRVADVGSLIKARVIENRGRFRPLYYVLRIIEAFLARDDAARWHMDRLLLALLSGLALYVAVRVLLDPLSAGVVTLLFFSGPQNEIWISLGPAESYGVPLLLVGSAWIAVQLSRHMWHPAQLFPGFVLLLLAGFTKESFIPCLPGALVFIYAVLPWGARSLFPDRLRLGAVDVCTLSVLIIGVGGQIAMTLKMLSAHGHVYAGDISPTSFAYAIQPALMRYSKDTLWFVPVVAGFARLVPRRRREPRGSKRPAGLIRMMALLAAGGLLILGPQWIIYGGYLGQAERYLTPGNVFTVFAAALGLHVLTSTVVERRHAELCGLVKGVLIAVACFRVLGSHGEAEAEATRTHRFQAKLAQIVQLKTQRPGLPVVFYSTSVSDREPLGSVARFLAVKLPTPERPYVHPFDWEKSADTPWKRELARSIRERLVEGRDRHFANIADLHGDERNCIGVVFSGASENCRCEYVVRLRD